MGRYAAVARLATALSTTALLVIVSAPGMAALAAEGPDFSACQDKVGREFAQCVAALARQQGSTTAPDGAGAAGEEHAAAVAALAQELVEQCAGKDGSEFGACVSALAQELGAAAADHPEGGAPNQAGSAGNAPDSAPGAQGAGGQPSNPGDRGGR